MRKTASFLLVAILALASPAQTTMLSWDMLVPQGTTAPVASAAGPGDLNGDGIPDAVFGTGTCVLAWSGFDGSPLWQVCDGPAKLGTSVAVAGDVDFDGRADIVAAAPGDASSAVPGYTLILSGATGAVVRTIPVGTTSVDGGRDFNGDGIPDQLGTFFLGWGVGYAGVHVFSGSNGAILFTQDDAWCGCYATIRAAFIEDLDADGFDDLVVAISLGVFAPGGVAVLQGPNGTLRTLITDFLGCLSLADIGDVTGDGQPEVGVFGGGIHSRLYVYDLGAGGAIPETGYLWSFTAPLLQPAGTASVTNGARVGDLDGDGSPDLVASGQATVPNPLPFPYHSPIQFLLSGANGSLISATTPGPPNLMQAETGRVSAAGDLNGDGTPEYLHAFPGFPTRMRVVSCSTLPAATYATHHGGSCGANVISLAAAPLRIGQPWNLLLQGGNAGASADLALDIAPPAPMPFAGCVWYPDLTHLQTWIIIPLILNQNGQTTPAIPVPTVPLAAGITVTIQAIVYGTSSPFGFDLSNGVDATAGF